jgi:hypothetical protein
MEKGRQQRNEEERVRGALASSLERMMDARRVRNALIFMIGLRSTNVADAGIAVRPKTPRGNAP